MHFMQINSLRVQDAYKTIYSFVYPNTCHKLL